MGVDTNSSFALWKATDFGNGYHTVQRHAESRHWLEMGSGEPLSGLLWTYRAIFG